jgi:GH25 family lysozyme M1 (1,4-beta-N-acetylmuramidase)
MQAITEKDLPGIDVSRHQGIVNWPQVASAGVKFAFIKATDGVGYVDPQFQRNAAEAHAAGLPIGFYHYAHPELNSAASEVNAFLSAVSEYPSSLPHVLDLEGKAANIGASAVTAWAYEWLSEVKNRTDRSVMLYTGASFARTYCGAKLAEFPLWIAHYGVKQPMSNPLWNRWSVFQYSETGACAGIIGTVDINVMDAEFYAQCTSAKEAEDVALDKGVAQTIINTWMSPSWKEANDAGNKEQADYIHWLANELRKAAGLPAE